MCLVLEVTFLFFAGLSLFSAYWRINISFDAMVTGRAESLLFDSGTSLLMSTFPAIQMPSSPHWALLALFSSSLLSPCGRRAQIPGPELGFSFLETCVGNDERLEAPQPFTHPLPQDCLAGGCLSLQECRLAGGCLSLQECHPAALSTYLLPAARGFVFGLVLAAGPLHDAFTGFGALRGSLFLWTGQRKTVAQAS